MVGLVAQPDHGAVANTIAATKAEFRRLILSGVSIVAPGTLQAYIKLSFFDPSGWGFWLFWAHKAQ
jgi:hypothetical protein